MVQSPRQSPRGNTSPTTWKKEEKGKLEAFVYKKKEPTAMISGFVKRFVTFDPRTLTLCYTRHSLLQDGEKTLARSHPEVTIGRVVKFRSTVISNATDVPPCRIRGLSKGPIDNWATPEDALRHCGKPNKGTIVINDQRLVEKALDFGYTSTDAPMYFGFTVNTADQRGLRFYFATADEASEWKRTINTARAKDGQLSPKATGDLDRISVSSARSTEDTDGEKCSDPLIVSV
jgi:hypothetical protein